MNIWVMAAVSIATAANALSIWRLTSWMSILNEKVLDLYVADERRRRDIP